MRTDGQHIVTAGGKVLAETSVDARAKITCEEAVEQRDPAKEIRRREQEHFDTQAQRVYLGVHHVTAGRGYNTESSNAVSLMTTINEIAAATSPYGHLDTVIHAVANDAAMSGTRLDTLHHRLGVPLFVSTKKAAEDSTR